MKALRFSSFGSPTDVVELTEIEPDDPPLSLERLRDGVRAESMVV